jgi:hypothetical protein
MKLSIELPDSLVDIDSRYLREGLLALLYHTGRLSEKQARETLGLTRRAFEETLHRFGLTALVDSRENLDIELGA